jgi:peptidoglycan-N-acetylglucosamine deacetylase
MARRRLASSVLLALLISAAASAVVEGGTVTGGQRQRPAHAATGGRDGLANQADPDGPGSRGGRRMAGAAGTPRAPRPPGPPAAGSPIMTHTGTSAVALTFDDGPGGYTPQMLALLRQYGIKATFCLIGVNVRANPGLVQQIVRDGHTLCNHTWIHDLQLGSRPAEAIRADLQRTNDEIHKAVPGVPIRYFRHPGGNFTPTAVAVARQLGMYSIGWSVDPSDWNIKLYPSGPIMTGHIIGNIERYTGPGAIVLSHDGGGDRSSTIAAYRVLLPWLKARYALVKLPT